MAIRANNVKIYVLRIICEDCMNEMEFFGMNLDSEPQKYQYVCGKCGKIEELSERYPIIQYRTDDGELLLEKHGENIK